MENLIFSSIPIETLKGELIEALRKEVQDCLSKQEPSKEQYITRNAAAQILGVSLPTLGKWTKEGLLVAYRISSRIRYKRQEVVDSLNKIKTYKK